jgi:exosortase
MGQGGARALFATAAVVALGQVVLSARFAYAGDYPLTLGIAWSGAVFVAWQRGPTGMGKVPVAVRLGGVAVAMASVIALGAGHGYRSYDRMVALAAGLGLAWAAAGTAGWKEHRTSVLLLALPLVDPPPTGLHRWLDPLLIPITTWSAVALNRLVGHPMTMDGNFIQMPDEALHVVDGCSGLWAIARLCVLVALVVALFPTNARQRVWLFASAVGVGLVVNAVRVAILAATVMHKDPLGFSYWHEGPGATVFALGTSVVAGLIWWALLARGHDSHSTEAALS